jgi:protoheme IX farnesyltransferase
MAVVREILSRIRLILNLGKIRIAILVTLSTFTGYVLASGEVDLFGLIPVAGVFLLALGAGALNQYQERFRDSLMPRTAGRPIPARQISATKALTISLFLLLAGTLVLTAGTNITAVALGMLTVIWYNGVYTYLKRISALAVIPGSLIGALPPLIGWASYQPDIFYPRPLMLALFFFIWQIPHFWLLLLNFGTDYEKAGYPSLTTRLDAQQLGRLTFVWIVATAVSIILLPRYGLGDSLVSQVLLFLSSILLIWRSTVLLRSNLERSKYLLAFKGINFFILIVMCILALDRLSLIG